MRVISKRALATAVNRREDFLNRAAVRVELGLSQRPDRDSALRIA